MLTPGRLRLGLGLPQAFLDGRMDLDLIRRYSRRAEELGFDDLWVMEQIVGRVPVLEPITLLSYVAAITERIRLGTSVLVTNLRNPVQLAKALSSLDHLSNGRLIAGIGLGTDAEAYEAFGVPNSHRVSRFVDGVRVMKALWTETSAQFDSPYWRLDGVSMEPKPLQQPSLPLWFGARVPDALRRAADYADGWMGAGSTSIADYLDQLKTMRSILEERGRGSDSFAISKRIYMVIDPDRERARARMREWIGAFYGDPSFGDRWAIAGSVDDVATVLNQLRDAGAQHVLLNSVFNYEQQLELIYDELIPRL